MRLIKPPFITTKYLITDGILNFISVFVIYVNVIQGFMVKGL